MNELTRPIHNPSPALRALGTDSRAIERAVEAMLPAPVKAALRPTYRHGDYGFEGISGYEVTAELPANSIQAALDALAAAHVPSTPDETVKEIARLLSVTKGRDGTAGELRMKIAVFAEELAHLPRDAVVSGCRAWARENVWAPSLAELLQACEHYCQRRRLMRAALEHAAWRRRTFGGDE